MLRVKQGFIKFHFLVFDMTQPGIEPRSAGPLANSLPKSNGPSDWTAQYWINKISESVEGGTKQKELWKF